MGFLKDLKERNVYRAAIAYLVVAWLVLQVGDVVFGIISTPQWVQQTILVLLVLGFPIAVVLAWVFERTPDGIRLESHEDRKLSGSNRRFRFSNQVIITLLALGVAFLLFDKFWLTRISIGSGGDIGSSIAVLPFENRSADKDDAYFVEGIHDDILTHLGTIGALKVISRTSVENSAINHLTIPEIGSLLGATAILEGAVQRAGDRVRVTVQLVDAVRDQQVWSESFDRQLSAANVFDIQSEVASLVASAMRTTLTSEEQVRLASRPTENIEAYEAYLLGRNRLNLRTGAAIREAQTYFREAIELDEDFALAWVGLADALRQQYIYEEGHIAELADQATQAIEMALSLEPHIAEAYAVRGAILHDQNEFTGSERDIAKALEINPNLVRAQSQRAELLFYHLDQREAAFEQIRQAISNDPLAIEPRRSLIWFNLSERQNEEALKAAHDLREVLPDDANSASMLGIISGFMLGDSAAGIQWMLEAVRQDPENPTYAAFVAAGFTDIDMPDLALAWIKHALRLGPNHYEPNDVAMFIYLQKGERAKALEYARRAFESNPYYASGFPLAVLAGADIENGKPDAVLERYQSAYPEFFQPEPSIAEENYRPAIDVAYILKLKGEVFRAQVLFDQIQSVTNNLPQKGFGGLFLYKARLHAAMGDFEGFMRALESALEAEVILAWIHIRDHDYLLNEFRGSPEFVEIATKFDRLVEQARSEVNQLIEKGLDVQPPPKD